MYGDANNINLAGNGLNSSRLPWDRLSHNPVDTESFLRGIGASNLENPQPAADFSPRPMVQNLQQMHLFENRPCLMPEPLVINKHQRPNWRG
jgi:hypothetical protein